MTRERIAVSRSAPIDESRRGAGALPVGRLLLAGAALCLVGAGALLWWHQGGAVFASLVDGALAWCM